MKYEYFMSCQLECLVVINKVQRCWCWRECSQSEVQIHTHFLALVLIHFRASCPLKPSYTQSRLLTNLKWTFDLPTSSVSDQHLERFVFFYILFENCAFAFVFFPSNIILNTKNAKYQNYKMLSASLRPLMYFHLRWINIFLLGK